MPTAQTYMVRLLREVENRLGRNGHPGEALKVGKIMQRLAQADDVQEELENLYKVECFSEFAMNLMWQLKGIEQGTLGSDNGAADHYASELAEILLARLGKTMDVTPPVAEPERSDMLTDSQHEVGSLIEELKRRSVILEEFKGIEESQLRKLLGGLLALREQASSLGRGDLARYADACRGFVQYVVDHSLFRDVRVLNILDSANLTLQTALATADVEDHSCLESTIQLLTQPKNLLD